MPTLLRILNYAIKQNNNDDKKDKNTIYLSPTPPESPFWPRFGANESSSSKNKIHGTAERALLKTKNDYKVELIILHYT